MRRCQHKLAAYERATAKVTTVDPDGDQPRELADLCVLAALDARPTHHWQTARNVSNWGGRACLVAEFNRTTN